MTAEVARELHTVYTDHMTSTTIPNAFESEVDTRIAEAATVYAKAAQSTAWYAKHAKNTFNGEEKLVEMVVERDAALVALSAVEAEYQGWSRFFLVQASNGHIHRSLHCSTCFPTTQYAWLPELSGLTEAEAVAEYGGILCSVCFPSAPSDWTTGVNKKEADRKAAEVAMKAIAKTPEGKAVIGKRDLVRRHQYRLDSVQSDVDCIDREHEAAATYGAEAKVTPGLIARRERGLAEQPKVVKQLAKAQAQLAEAEAALDAALSI